MIVTNPNTNATDATTQIAAAATDAKTTTTASSVIPTTGSNNRSSSNTINDDDNIGNINSVKTTFRQPDKTRHGNDDWNANEMKHMNIYKDTIQKKVIRIVMFVFILVCIVCHVLIHPLVTRIFSSSLSSSIQTWLSLTYYTPSFQSCFTICIIMIFLSLGIAVRYVGRTSIMRCSFVPLRTNPWYVNLQYLFRYPLLFLQPGNQTGELLFPIRTNNRYRYYKSGNTSTNGTFQHHVSPVKATTIPSNTTMTTITSAPNGLNQAPSSTTTTTRWNDNTGPFRDNNIHLVSIHKELVGRRYHGATVWSIALQLIFAILIGWIISFVVIFRQDKVHYNSTNQEERSMFRIVCCLSVLGPILFTILAGDGSQTNTKHQLSSSSSEIDVTIYLYPLSNITEWLSIIRHRLTLILISTILFPFVGVILVQQQSVVVVIMQFLRMNYGRFMLYSFMISCYLYYMDDIMKVYVIHCLNRHSIKQSIIDDVMFDRSYQTTLDIVLRCLLCDSNIVLEVLRITDQDNCEQGVEKFTTNTAGRERAETDKCYPLIQQFAQILLLSTPTTATQAVDNNKFVKRMDSFNFEEDLLRLLFLESIGGDAMQTAELTAPSNVPLQLLLPAVSRRHQNEIKNWIDITATQIHDDDMSCNDEADENIYNTNRNHPVTHSRLSSSKSERQQRKDIATSLVRGLSILIGGYGEALSLCASPITVVLPSSYYYVASSSSSQYDESFYSWTISSSAVVALQFAVQAVARCVLRSYQQPSSGQVISEWMNSILAHMIPSVLTSFFYLRVGIINYVKFRSQPNSHHNNSDARSNQAVAKPTMNFSQAVRMHDTNLFQLLQMTDRSALVIVRVIQCHSSKSNIRLEVDEDVMEWIQRLLAKND